MNEPNYSNFFSPDDELGARSISALRPAAELLMAPKKEPKPKKNAPKPGSPGGTAAVPKQSQQKPAAEVASDQQPLLAEKMGAQ